jgi:integrase
MAYTIESPLKGESGDGKENGQGEKDYDLPGRDRTHRDQGIGMEGPGVDGGIYPACAGRVHEGQGSQEGWCQMRGDGGIYSRGNVLWIFYSFRGQIFRESAHTSEEKVARKLLKARLKQVERPGFVGPKEEKWTLADMKEKIRFDYERKGNRSFDDVENSFKHLEAEGAFKFHRVVDITSEKIAEYGDKRLKAGAARASINYELACLRHGFKLMVEAAMIATAPTIKLYEVDNVRQGFIDVADFNALLGKVEGSDARDIIKFQYHAGWRSIEAKAFRWSWIDGDMIRVPKEVAKNKKDRSFPIIGTLLDVIERRKELRRLDCPYVFHRAGKPIRSFRKAFKAAAKAVGREGLLPHDMRRSAVRNFRKAGLSEGDGMMLSGHRTRSVYERYNIRDDRDLTESMSRVQEHLKFEAENRKVVQLSKRIA